MNNIQDNHGLKIFLSYHKDTPLYKSDVFEPISVGGGCAKSDFHDNTGYNISHLNLYYCELTGHYWVFKNFIPNSDCEYIGFGHYRRIPDLTNISENDTPSIYGMTYSESISFFEEINKQNLLSFCKPYDIILPCSVYLYANTVNPALRQNEPHYNMYNQFQIEHKNNLLDVLKSVISKYYPEYLESYTSACADEKIHCFNMYIMKQDILNSFFCWEFDILEKIGVSIGGWEQPEYLRMAGFLGERLINIWLKYNNRYKIGYMPIYMIDFEADYIIKANECHQKGDYIEEISILKNLLAITADKFNVLTAIATLYDTLSDKTNFDIFIKKAVSLAKTADDYNTLANLTSKINNKLTVDLYKKSVELAPEDKFFAQSFLNYATEIKDLNIIKQAWNCMLSYDLSAEEKEKYDSFIKIYNMINL